MLHDRVVQRLIAFFLADLNHARDLVRFSFAHEVRNGGVDDQNLERSNAAWFVDALEQVLGNHTLDRFRHNGPDFIFLPSPNTLYDTIAPPSRYARLPE